MVRQECYLGTLVCGVLKNEQTLSERTAREMKSTAGSQVLGEEKSVVNTEHLICLGTIRL